MIVCDAFVFLHLHKSGGTFVNEMILRNFPGARLLGYHLPFACLPERYRSLPLLGTVRNPWAYYVSWFHFQSGQAQPNALYLVCSDQGRLGFEDTIRNLVTLADDDARVDALVEAFPETFPNRGLNLTKSCIARIRGTRLGFYSFLYARHYQGAGSLTLVEAENLRTQLRAYLETKLRVGNPSATRFIVEAPPLNTTRHAPYREYYSPELAELVRERDALVIRNHDYRF
jgi:hypothetical protein